MRHVINKPIIRIKFGAKELKFTWFAAGSFNDVYQTTLTEIEAGVFTRHNSALTLSDQSVRN